jgi:4a-hydroxytetrahydrobiopterin dehydratase
MERRKLTDKEIDERLSSLPGWEHSDGKLRREIATGNFMNGLKLVTKIADVAEAMNHHPDVLLTYPRVVIEIFTHDVGGITDFDFSLAERISSLAQ